MPQKQRRKPLFVIKYSKGVVQTVEAHPTPMALISGRQEAEAAAAKRNCRKYFDPAASALLSGITSAPVKVDKQMSQTCAIRIHAWEDNELTKCIQKHRDDWHGDSSFSLVNTPPIYQNSAGKKREKRH